MTKAEIKNREKERKYDFIARVYETVLKCIPAETRTHCGKVQVRITHQNCSRYIRFSAYGRNLAFLIYGDGNVAVELKEAFHSDHAEQLFVYDTDTKAQETFIRELAETASCLIRVFIEKDVLDFHSYMDYVSEENNISMAYRKMQDEYSCGDSADNLDGTMSGRL